MAIFTKETGRSCASLHPRHTDRPDHNFLNALRKSSYSLEKLPDEITIPALRYGDGTECKPLLLATVDDVAFAQQGLNKEMSRLVEKMEALRRLHDMARGLGAKGSDYALEFVREHGEVKP